MRIFVFKSDMNTNLRAFAADRDVSKLPTQFRPWHAIGSIAPDKDPPYQFSREQIEEAINDQGFQLWRMKTAAKTG
jgi:hypothetical protein